jgi:hypothetical protein
MNTKTISKSLMLVFMALFLSACTLSTEDLTQQVKEDMMKNAKFKENSVTVVDLKLVKKTDTEYTGLLKTTEPGGEKTYDVQVTYDGSTFKWEVVDEINK